MTPLTSEEMVDLAMTLRSAGYTVGPDQCIAAQRMMLTLASLGAFLESPRCLKTWLAPIFCGTPSEQAEFYQHYDRWIAHRGEAVEPEAKDTTAGNGARDVEGKRSQVQTSIVRRLLVLAAIVLFIAAIAFLSYDLYCFLSPRTLHAKVVDSQNHPTRATVFFLGKTLASDQNGDFTLAFRLSDLRDGRGVVAAESSAGIASQILDSKNYKGPLDLQLKQSGTNGTPVKTESVAPLPPAETQSPSVWEMIYSEYYRLISIVAVVGPFVLLGIWMFWVYLPRLQLIRWKTHGEPRLDALRVKGSGVQLFTSASFRRTAQELSRHRRLETRDLDPDRMVIESARRCGWFTPVYRLRKELPDYLLLIDRAGFRDFNTRLAKELVNKLRRSNVEIACYYFYGDPRICYPEPVGAQVSDQLQWNARPSPSVQRSGSVGRVSGRSAGATTTDNEPDPIFLGDLAAKYAAHHLLIFSDADGVFSSLTGGLHSWSDMFSNWNFRAFLLPEHLLSSESGYRVAVLEDRGFHVLTADESGLSELSKIIQAESDWWVGRSCSRPATSYPVLLKHDDSRWVGDVAPDPATVSRLLAQVRRYLGRDAFYWLCACAVYPELLWDIILYLGHELDVLAQGRGQQQLSELVRLPWFRHGAIPDWLREPLVGAMPSEKQELVRKALWRLLSTALERPVDNFELPYVKDAAEAVHRSRSGKWLTHRLLNNFLRTEPPSSPLRDYVFLSFLEAKNPGQGLAVPEELRKLWGRFGQPRRPVMQTIIAVLATIAITGVMWAKRPSTKPFDLTVKVHSADVRDPAINSGKITIDVGNTRHVQTIGANGEATFKEIPAGFRSARVNLLPQVNGYKQEWQQKKVAGNLLDVSLVRVPAQATHLFGSIVPPQTNWARIRILVDGVDGQQVQGIPDGLGKFELPVNGKDGDSVRLHTYDDNKLVYDGFVTLPGPVLIALHQPSPRVPARVPTQQPSTGVPAQVPTQQPELRGSSTGPMYIYGRVVTNKGQSVAEAEVRIEGAGSDVTTDSGQFRFPLLPPLKVGFPVTFSVRDFVVISPCLLVRGRIYLPDPASEAILITVVKPGDPALLSTNTNPCNSPAAEMQTKSDQSSQVQQPAAQQKELGKQSQNESAALNNQAKSLVSQGRYAEAAPFYQEALVADEKALGSSSPQVASDLNNLGNLYVSEEKFAEAEPLYKRALNIDEEALGPSSPQVASDLNNLGNLYVREVKVTEAEPLYKRALSIDERALGSSSPQVASDLNNLGNLYVGEGKFTEAEPLYKRGLAIYEKALGPDHPTVATIAENLARALRSLGRDSEATVYEDQAAKIRGKKK